jgi:ABC-type thiamine transport system substrate-binding protein
MPKIKDKKSYYVITNEKNFTFGAFNYNDEGLKKAKKYLKDLKKKNSDTFFIKEVK